MIIELLLSIFLTSLPAVAEEPQHLVYALPMTETAAVAFIALDKGFFKEEGLDVEGKMFSSGREALQALLAGQAQLQSVSETPIVHAIIQGNKVATVARSRGTRKRSSSRGKITAS